MTAVLIRLQVLLLALVAPVAALSTLREVFYEFFPQANVPIDFRTVNVSRPDYVAGAFLLVSVARLVSDPALQDRVASYARPLLRLGGLWWIALVGWLLAGMAWAEIGLAARYEAVHALLLLLLAVFVAEIVTQRGADGLLAWFVVGALLQAALAIAQVINRGPLGLEALGEIPRFAYDPDTFFRGSGLSMHPNYLGGYLMLALAACAHLVVATRSNRVQRIVWIAAGVVLLAGMIATLSRSAILGTLIGALPILVMALRQFTPRRRLALLSIIGIGALLLAAWVWIAVAGDVQTRFLTGREFFFTDTFSVLQRSPVLGVGAGNLMWHVTQVREFTLEGNLLPVHNVYIYVWAEAGVPGIILFMLALLPMLRGVIRWRSIDLFVWSCGWLAIAVVMLFDNYWWAVHPYRVLLLWALGVWWGLALRERA